MYYVVINYMTFLTQSSDSDPQCILNVKLYVT